ncbi:DUF3298 and DUF4163 domain-containing protein [Mitsuokella sp. AF33-22]|uniref:DUF3298 and DUF4163 domain-containing protein n=1 Tax=Mitsuokella sp. AF33-22 TaxID=2292047 RepID=UPI000E4A8A56|nr:DUF3298 and DUF4163 domain-containing protein [Mitsuokella sp. AF33-22]RHM55828.1 DUF3298/DUF4163 domain-containing protein [Mitsuokella sp. AF33-22]
MRKRQLTRLLLAGLCTISLWGVPLPAGATVETGTDTKINYTMNYPLVYTQNPDAQEAINSDIYTYIADFRAAYERGDFIDGSFSYEVKYEDEQVVSIVICEYKWTGGAHGMPNYIGLNYDKATGEKLPLSYFVRLTPADRVQVLGFPVYNARDEVIPDKDLSQYRWDNAISTNYYMLGNGDLALIYQPYDLAPYAAGVTHIKLTAKWIDYFNRRNHAE